MDWLRSSSVAIVSEDRRDLAWRRPTEPRQMATLLGGFDTADEAQARCLDDALTAAAVQP